MKGKWWKILHWIIILNFVLEIAYGGYMVFFVIGGSRYPLFRRAVETPIEVILKRRLYSVETWIATAGLAVYLALTEIVPRQRKLEADREKGI
jgi:hypothetical protein